MMTELEMTNLCAKAMGATDERCVVPKPDGGYWQNWQPLQDDAQAMALVKKLNLSIRQCCAMPEVLQQWCVNEDVSAACYHLNAAIVRYVAKKMQLGPFAAHSTRKEEL